jgi:hypothetical protein
MTPGRSVENAILAGPLVLFLLAILGFPTVLSLVYGFSDTSFQTLTTPQFSGLKNFRDVTADPTFWQAAWFSLRFGDHGGPAMWAGSGACGLSGALDPAAWLDGRHPDHPDDRGAGDDGTDVPAGPARIRRSGAALPLQLVRLVPVVPGPGQCLQDRCRGRDAAMDALCLSSVPDRLPVDPAGPARGGGG